MDRARYFTSPRSGHSLKFRLLASVTSFLPQPQQRAGIAGGSRNARRKSAALTAAAGAYALSSLITGAQAQTLPQGGNVVAGSASINQATPNSLNIVQSTNSAIINWQSFNIGAGQSVNFQQPSASSITLNRVLGNDPSAIFGTLTANGTVMLVNPNGVFFGPGSRVDVGGLVATTANIKDADFMAGKYLFGTPGNANAQVVNQGDISIKDTGLAALVAPQVHNSGVIRARLGKVTLGAAQSFTLDFYGDGLLSFGIGAEASNALVVNSGQIAADGGVVELSARAVKGVIDNVINTSGVVQAKSVGVQNGKIVLSGGSSGKVEISGSVDASGSNAAETGGKVIATGADIVVGKGATINVSGEAGGGQIALGSDGSGERGRADGVWSDTVTVAGGAQLKADAIDSGNGGLVTVLSNDRTVFAGSISARGGAQDGDGGFAEVSSHKDIHLTGSADMRAPKGKTGTLLIDPTTLKIVSGTGATQDTAGNDGNIAAGDADVGANTISENLLESLNSTTNIVLEASGLITVDTMTDGVLNLQTGTGHGFTLRSTTSGGITFTDSATEIRTAGGAITLEANGPGSSITNVGKLNSDGGNITLLSSGSISLANEILASGGTLTLQASNGNITTANSSRLRADTVNLIASGSIGSASQSVALNTGTLSLKLGGSFYIDNIIGLNALNVNATHASASTTNAYVLTAGSQTYTIADSTSETAIAVTNGLNLGWISDRTIKSNGLDIGGTLKLTSTGGDILQGSGSISATSYELTAKGSTGSNGAIGSSGSKLSLQASGAGNVSAIAGSGGIYLADQANSGLALNNIIASGGSNISSGGTLTVGNVALGSNALTLASTGGSILNDSDAATTITAGSLALQAGGSIGTNGTALTTSASSISASGGTGGIYITTSGFASFSSVSSTSGVIALNVGGNATISSLTNDSTSAVTVTASDGISIGTLNAGNGDVTLNSVNSITSSGGSGITANKLVMTGSGSGGAINVTTAAKDITASISSGITINNTGNVTLTEIISQTGSISVTGSGDITVSKLTTKGSSTAVTLNATSGNIIGATGNKIIGDGLSIRSKDVGSSSTHINTSVGTLSVENTGSFYVDNTNALLKSLVIKNSHNGSTPNTLHLTSPEMAFTVTDDGSKTSLSEINSAFLTNLIFTSDKTLVVGQLDLENASSVALTSAASIIDDANKNTRITGQKITLTAGENIGESGNAIGINTTSFVVTTAGNLLIENINHFEEISITSTHKDSGANYTYAITGRHLDFALTDSANGYTFTRLIDSGYGADGALKTFTFSGDRSITLGKINVGAQQVEYTSDFEPITTNSSVSFTSTGAIKDDGSDSTAVQAGYIRLKGSSIGASDANMDIDIVAKGISAQATAGDLYITAHRTVNNDGLDTPLLVGSGGTMTNGFSATGNVSLKLLVGDIQISSNIQSGGTTSLQADVGSILGSSSISSSGKLTLKASESIGTATASINFSASEIDAIATNGLVSLYTSSSNTKFNEVTSGGAIKLTGSSNNFTLGKIIANAGASSITVSGASTINDDGNDATVIQGSEIGLSAQSGLGNTNQLKLNTTKLTTSSSGAVNIASSQALTDLSVTRTSSSGGVSITGTGQTFTLAETGSAYTISTLTSASNLNFALGAQGSNVVNVSAANVGTGKFTLSSGGGIAYVGSGSDKIVAGEVSLTAGSTSSIGASNAAVQVSTGKMSLSAGRDIYVNSSVALTHVYVTSTNNTTASGTASKFGITGASGPAVSITDSGTTQTVDVTGNITDFSLINQKNISVSEIVATGAVKLATSGGGANSNITSINSAGIIVGASITLSASGTGTGNGSIGSSTTALSTKAVALNITSNGSIYLSNNSLAVSTLSVTSTHKSAATSDINTYSFSNIGTGRSFTVSEASGVQSVAMSSGSGTMDFSYSVDRAINTGTIDAGTSSTGKISLTSTGGATGVAGSINGDTGTLTAGEIILSANVSTGSGLGRSGQISTSTQKLSLITGGSFDVSNSATLTDLSLDVSFRASGTPNSGTYLHGLSSTGLTLTVEDVIVSNSVSAFKLTSVSQSGLNLNVNSSTNLQVTSVNVGSGTVKLNANNGSSSINATTTGSSVVTAGRLELTANSIGNTNTSYSTFYGTVGTLKAAATTINYQNEGNLALDGLNSKVSSSGGSVTLTVNNGSLTQAASSTERVSAEVLTLKVSNGSIGTNTSSVLIDVGRMTLTSGLNVYLDNSADLSSLKWTLGHSSTTNNYGFTGKNLSATIGTSTASGTTTFTQFVDTSGLDFTLSVDTNLALGTITAQSGRALSLTTTGTTKNITTTNTSLALTADKISLTATGSVGASGTAIQTVARDLVVNTAANVHLNNGTLDLQTLSITSSQATGGSAPTFGVTGDNLTFSIAETSGTAAVAVSDTTGLDFTFATVRPQKLGVINLTSTGKATLSSTNSILGSTSNTDRLTAGNVTLKGAALGSSTDKLYIDAPIQTLTTDGNIYIDSGVHVEKLKLTNSSANSTANRTFSISGLKLDGSSGMSVQATHTNAGGTVFTTISDTSGLDFELANDRIIEIGTINLGKSNRLSLTASPGIRETDGTSSILAGDVTLVSASGAIGQASGTGGGLIDVTASNLSVTANNGAYVDMKQRTVLTTTVAGTSQYKVSDGDLVIGGGNLSLNGATTTLEAANGSILNGGGSIYGAGTLTLTASGSIGEQNKVLSLQANSNGTTTLSATANGGGIYITESYGLTVSSMTAAGDIVLQSGSSGSSRNMTIAGAITANGKSVSLTAINGAIKSTTSSSIDAAALTLISRDGSIGESTSSTTKVKTTATKLTLNSSKDIYVTSTGDLTDLSIDRAPSTGTSNSNGALTIEASNLTWSAADNGTATTFTNVTDTTGLNFTYLSRGNIIVDKISVGSGDVTLQARQGVSTTAATITGTGTNKITAGNLKLSTNSVTNADIGSSGTALGLNVSGLNATGTNVYVKNDGALSATLSSSGDLSVTANTGDLTINSLSYGSTKALTLKATAGAINYAGLLTLSGGSITLESATGIGSAFDAMDISVSGAGTLTTSTTGSGGTYLNISGNLSGGLTATSANGPINVTGSGSLKLTSATVTGDAIGNDITVKAGTTLSVGEVTAGANYGAANLIAGTTITQLTGSTSIAASKIGITAGSGIGSSGTPFAVAGKSVSLSANNNAIYAQVTGATTLASVAAGTGAVTITTGTGPFTLLASKISGSSITMTGGANTLILGDLNAGTGSVAITASTSGGKILDDGLTNTRIVGGSVSLTGDGGVGTSTARMQTTTALLTANSNTTGPGIFIEDNGTSEITLSARARGGDADITTAAATKVTLLKADVGSVKLVGSSGDITLTSVSADTTSGVIEINSASKILSTGSSDHITGHTLKLTSASGIGTLTNFAAGTGSQVKINVSSINTLSATGASSVINIANTGNLSLNGGILSLGSGGSAYIAATGNLTLTHAVDTSIPNLALVSGGTLTLPNAAISTTGALVISATTDVVKSGGADREFTLSGDTVKFSSGSAGGDTTLKTTTASLDASLTGTGGLIVSNTGNLTTGKFSTTNGDISVTSSTGITASNVSVGGTNKTAMIKATTGDVTVETLNAGGTGTIKLIAEAGSVLMGTSPSMTGNTLDITSFSSIGSSANPFTTSFANFAAKVTGAGDIHLGFSGTGTTGTLITTDGDIYVTANGTLTVDGSKITAGNSGNLSLKSTGAVALNNGYTSNGTNTAKSGVTIEGNGITLSTISTTGAQSYKGDTFTQGNLTAKSIQITGGLYSENKGTFDTSAANGDIQVTGQFDGRTNDATFTAGSGKVSFGNTAFNLGTLSITAGTISLVGVETEGAQSYTGATEITGSYTSIGGAIDFKGATKLMGDTTISTNGGALTFDSTLDGGNALSIESGAGNVKFVGAVGNTTRLGNLQINSSGATSFASTVKVASINTDEDGTLAINGGSVDATGSHTYNEIAFLGANTTLTGTTITLEKGVQGVANLAIAGNLVLNDKLSVDSNLGTLTVSGTTRLFNGTINTTGNQTYTGLVTLNQNTTFTGTTVTFQGGIAGGNRTLSVVGNAVFTGDIGAGTVPNSFPAQQAPAPTSGPLTSVSVSGTTVLAGGTIVTSGNQNYTGATNLTGNHVLTTNSGKITFGSTVDSTSHSNLTLNLGDVAHTFTNALGTTDALGVLTINAGSNGSVSFDRTASIKTTGNLTFTGGTTLLLPADIDVGGAITVGVLTSTTGEPQAISGITPTLATGEVKIKAGGNIVMAGLSGSETDLTISSSGGYIKIGSKDTDQTGPQPTKKIVVKTLKSEQASSIDMYGTVANRSDATAAYIVGPLKGPPYYINDMRWGPIENQVTIPQSVVPPPTTIPTSPQAGALFTRTVDAGGLNPNALLAFTAPTVLNVSPAPTFTVTPSAPQGGGVNPGTVTPTSSSSPLGTGGSSQSGGTNPGAIVPSSSASPVGGTGGATGSGGAGTGGSAGGGTGGATGGSQPGQPNSEQQQQQQQGAAAQ